MHDDIKSVLGMFAIALGLISYADYILGIWRKQIKPHLFSWIIWAIMSGLTTAAQFVKGAGVGNWVWIQATIACFFISILALFHGDKTKTRTDWLCFAGALCAISLWTITDNPVWAVIIAAAIDIFAFVPTFRKSWFEPHQEGLLMWVLALLRYGMSLVTMDAFNTTTVLCSAVTIILNMTLVTIIISRRRSITKGS